MEIPQNVPLTIDEIYALPDGKHAELIDGLELLSAIPRCAKVCWSGFK